MAGIRSHLVSVRTPARRLVDEATAEFWSNDDIDESYEEACAEIWAEVVAFGRDWAMRTDTIAIVSGTELYAMSAESLRVRRVARQEADGTYTPILPLSSVNAAFGVRGSALGGSAGGARDYIEGHPIGVRP